jgi:hypothetical protein
VRKFTSYENIGILLGPTGIGSSGSADTSTKESSFCQLTRVQQAVHSFSFNRIDLNQVSSFKGVDSPVVSEATIAFQASYLLTSGQNEEDLGLYMGEDKSCLYNIYSANAKDSRSIFLVSSNKGDNRDLNLSQNLNDTVVVGLGNSFINSYSMSAAVGDFPSSDIEFSCSNVKFDINESNDIATGTCPSVNFVSGNFEGMPDYEIESSDFDSRVLPVSAIRPGDITLELDEIQFGQLLASTSAIIAIQSISIGLPVPRTTLNGFGSNYIYGSKPVFPAPAAISISLNETDFKQGNLDEIFSLDKRYSFTININRSSTFLYRYKVDGAMLLSQNFSSSIGEVASVELEFVCDVTPFDGLSVAITTPDGDGRGFDCGC